MQPPYQGGNDSREEVRRSQRLSVFSLPGEGIIALLGNIGANMPPRKRHTSRPTPRVCRRFVRAFVPPPGLFKTRGVAATDLIRVLVRSTLGIFRDGMTVGEFVSSVPDRRAALTLLIRCQKAGTIGFQQGVAPAGGGK